MTEDFKQVLEKEVDPEKNYFEELARILAEKKNVSEHRRLENKEN